MPTKNSTLGADTPPAKGNRLTRGREMGSLIHDDYRTERQQTYPSVQNPPVNYSTHPPVTVSQVVPYEHPTCHRHSTGEMTVARRPGPRIPERSVRPSGVDANGYPDVEGLSGELYNRPDVQLTGPSRLVPISELSTTWSDRYGPAYARHIEGNTYRRYDKWKWIGVGCGCR